MRRRLGESLWLGKIVFEEVREVEIFGSSGWWLSDRWMIMV